MSHHMTTICQSVCSHTSLSVPLVLKGNLVGIYFAFFTHTQGPYSFGHLKFKAIQEFSRYLKNKFKTVLTTSVLSIAIN